MSKSNHTGRIPMKGFNPEQTNFIMASQANELRQHNILIPQLQQTIVQLQENVQTCQVLLGYAVRDNPMIIDPLEVQQMLAHKRINFENLSDGRIKIYLTDMEPNNASTSDANCDNLPGPDSLPGKQA